MEQSNLETIVKLAPGVEPQWLETEEQGERRRQEEGLREAIGLVERAKVETAKLMRPRKERR